MPSYTRHFASGTETSHDGRVQAETLDAVVQAAQHSPGFDDVGIRAGQRQVGADVSHPRAQIGRRAAKAHGLLAVVGFAQQPEVLPSQQRQPLPRIGQALQRARIREQQSCVASRERLQAHGLKGAEG